jgi:hypothetical protein
MNENKQTLPMSSEPLEGAFVEMTDILLASTAGGIRAYKALGRRPAGSVNAVDYFGVSIGEKARVIRQDANAVLVQILDGPWRGREGWTLREGFRIPPTAAESSAQQVGDLTLLERREIYAACHAAGLKAVSFADASHPFDRMPADREAARACLSKRENIYKNTREKGRHGVLERYGIDPACLDAIDQEGDREKWPVWDGLSDERGPIPSFHSALPVPTRVAGF